MKWVEKWYDKTEAKNSEKKTKLSPTQKSVINLSQICFKEFNFSDVDIKIMFLKIFNTHRLEACFV